ncbi:MAG: VWA domain-containing protein, partial [Pyrinomonadaceae bacterium]
VKSFITICIVSLLSSIAGAQDVVREVSGGFVEVVNRSGRVLAKAEGSPGSTKVGNLTASSAKGVSDAEIKISSVGGRTLITVASVDAKKRIDLSLTLPERTSLKVETAAGGIEAMGNFASVIAKTETGTIAVDVPAEDLTYNFLWIESRPRYLADFDIAKVKEKTAGRFEIRGTHKQEGEKRRKGDEATEDPKTEDQKPKAVSLNLTTARGIILLNVSPNEVMSDLRERPLTNAAKAIVRSGDSLLMEAIRRASPKYFGDYARSLPPIMREPSFAQKGSRLDVPNAEMRTALVRVTDLKNRAIDDLTAADFEVTESGTAREVVDVTRSTAPFNLVLLLDVSGSVENYVNFIRKAARNFVDTVEKSDRVSIVMFNDDVKVLSPFTTDKEKLSKSLDTFDAGGGTAYYDALAYSIADTLRPMKGERTAIVILTDGDDNRSFLAFDSLLGSIQESGALLYPLYVPSGLLAAAAANPDADIDPVRRKYMSLSVKAEGEGERLAKVSGGVYYPITDIAQIQRAYEDIVVQLRAAYNVTFTSNTSLTTNGASPRIKIRSKRPNTFTTVNSIIAAQ